MQILYVIMEQSIIRIDPLFEVIKLDFINLLAPEIIG